MTMQAKWIRENICIPRYGLGDGNCIYLFTLIFHISFHEDIDGNMGRQSRPRGYEWDIFEELKKILYYDRSNRYSEEKY